jgi:hypothetical protein
MTVTVQKVEALTSSVKRVPANIGKHGTANDESSDDQSCEDASPEPDSAERDEENTVSAREINARLIGQECLNSHCNQKPSGPDQGDSEGELKGDVHHLVDGSSLVQGQI